MLILHTSDTHLGASKPSKLRDRELDFYEVFDEVVEIAIKEGVDAVIHCGDLFDDARPNPQTYYYVFKSLKKLREVGIEFLVIAGQHDMPKVSALSPIKVLEEVGLVKALATSQPLTHVVKLRSGELGITAIPYADPITIQEYIRVVKKPNTSKKLLMAHLLLKELNIPEAHVTINDLRVSEYNYVALGDYHIRYEVNVSGTPVIYPGATESLNILEGVNDKYVALVDFSSGEVVVNWVKLSKPRKWLVVKPKDYEELRRFLEGLEYSKFNKPPILHIEIGSKEVLNLSRKLIINLLSSLRDKGKILTYKVEAPGVSEEGDVGYSNEEPIQTPTLELVVHNLIKDPVISDYVVRIVKGCDDVEFIKLLINGIINDPEVINKLEKLVSVK